MLLRLERPKPGLLDQEGDQRRNLRAFYEANNEHLSDEAASNKASRPDSAVDDLLNRRRAIGAPRKTSPSLAPDGTMLTVA